MAITGDTEYLTIHTKWHVVLTTWTWRVDATRPSWSRRWPAWRNGVIERGSQPHGQQVANWCNTYNVDYLSGVWTPGLSPLPNFRNAYWNAATNLGKVKLLHQFWMQHFPSTRSAIEAEVATWANDMRSSKYARIRLSNGQERPLILYWGHEMEYDYPGFIAMINTIRQQFRTAGIGEVFIVGTVHLLDQAALGRPGAMEAFRAVDGFYTSACALPGSPGVTWDAEMSANRLDPILRGWRDFANAHGKTFFSGTTPQFDRDLYHQWKNGKLFPLGRVVARSGAQVRKLLSVAAKYAPLVSERHVIEADGEHIYEDKWIILSTLDEWEEGTAFEPCLVRGPLYSDPYYEYDTDAMKAISEIFRDRVRRFPVSNGTPVQESIEELV